MKTKIQIFAQYGTNKKIVIRIPEELSREILSILEKKLGGRWLLVDDLFLGEGIIFECGMIYKGFSPDIDRYTDKIQKVF